MTGVSEAGGGASAAGERAIATGINLGVNNTGDYARFIQLPAGALRSPEQVPEPTRLANLPRPPVDPFVGRIQELEALEDALSQVGSTVVTQAVFGLGGVGKTELALQYVARHRSRYPLVWWISGEDPEHIETGLAELTRRLDPTSVLLGATAAEAASWAVTWLQAHHGWLLILDNVESPHDIAALLGQISEYGHVVITTRRDLVWRGAVRPLFLPVLTPEQSDELLAKLTGLDEPDAIRAIADDLGHLPLALEQAGAYIAQQRITGADYLRLLRDRPSRMFDVSAEGGDAERTIARVWRITLDTIGSQHPLAVFVLTVLAYFSSDDLPRDVLTATARDAAEVNEALGVLASYSMISLTTTTVRVHRLVQAVLRTQSDVSADIGDPTDGPRPVTVATTLLNSAVPTGDATTIVTGWALWRTLLPHIQNLSNAIPDERATSDLSWLLAKAGIFASGQGQHNVALALEQRVVSIVEAIYGPEHPHFGAALDNLAGTLRDLGRPADALPLCQRALAITEATHEAEHPTVAHHLDNLAGTLRDLGRPAEALLLHGRALLIAEAAHGPDHASVAVKLNNLAGTLQELGQPAESLPLRQRALAITEAAYGPNHPSVATRLDNLATNLRELGRAADAIPLHERALSITEAAYSTPHPDVARRLNNLAFTLAELGRLTEALSLQERALAITDAVHGPNHPAFSIRLNNLAQTLRELGRPEEALPLQERALIIAEAAHGPDHPAVAVGAGNLAGTLSVLGKSADALPLFRRALSISENARGASHPEVSIGLTNLATALVDLGRPAEALPLQERALAIAVSTLGPRHPTTGVASGSLASVLQALNRPADALPLHERALAIAEATYGPDHPHVAGALNNLATTLDGLGRQADALPLQQRALTIAEATYGPDHPTTTNIRQGIATLRENMNAGPSS